MNNCEEEFNTQIAYILKNKDDKIDDKIGIAIDDYLKNKDLREEIENGKKLLKCINMHELIKCESYLVKPYFRHKNNEYRNMTNWHREWQNYCQNEATFYSKIPK
mgnify:CR=1 FL=1